MDGDLAQKVRAQVEYYFSDENYPTDKFLKKLAKRDGFVPLAAIASFSKIIALTEDTEFLVEALRPSEKLILSEDCFRVKRKDPLPPPKTKQYKVKGNLIKKFKGQSLVGQTSVRLDGNLDPVWIEPLLSQVSHISSLDLRKNNIGPQGGLLLSQALLQPDCKLSYIFLFNCGLGDEGIKHMSLALQTNTSLNKLNLCENGFTSEAGPHVAALLAKNKTLTCLDLNNNPFRDAGAKLIAEAFIGNSTIKTFSMWNTGITDATAELWLSVLDSNKTLQKLNLNGNHLSAHLLAEMDNKLHGR